MPVNAKKLMLSVGGSNSGFWFHTHQTMPLSSSDISKGQKATALDWRRTAAAFSIMLTSLSQFQAQGWEKWLSRITFIRGTNSRKSNP
jgi:hypothetical protein